MSDDRDFSPGVDFWNRYTMSSRFEQMLDFEGTTMAFEIERGDDTIEQQGEETTFSPPAVDQLLIDQRTWLFSRLSRYMAEHPERAARTLRVTMKVELE